MLPSVFLPLEIPRRLPDFSLAETRWFVSQDRQERDGLGLDQFSHESGHIEVFPTTVDGSDLQELVIATGFVRQFSHRLQSWLMMLGIGPVGSAFQSVEQPVLQGTLLLVVPTLGIPAPLVFRFFDQADFFVVFRSFRCGVQRACGMPRANASESR